MNTERQIEALRQLWRAAAAKGDVEAMDRATRQIAVLERARNARKSTLRELKAILP